MPLMYQIHHLHTSLHNPAQTSNYCIYLISDLLQQNLRCSVAPPCFSPKIKVKLGVHHYKNAAWTLDPLCKSI